MIKKLIVLAFILSSIYLQGQSPKRVLKKIGDNPIYFIDSINVSGEELKKYNPNQIASVTVFKGKEAIELLGENGKDGAIYIETVNFSRLRYWKFFSSKSSSYSELVPSFDSDSNIQYILNDRVLTDNFEGDLATINDDIFKDIKIIDKKTLQKEYEIHDKDYGVVILSNKPKDLYKARKKF
ncbi:hypothetical protein ABN763_12915 [Spongiivirga sp. MCCC 1A20706]|uniref:hypothetical protein n=1 Tax=Spongiivirga sp. MCCC 1A20706 TaxID=3160963 RepID=UPI003977E04F